jgi:hypothetical protein
MPAQSTDDYSKYPEPLRDVLPYLHGEVCYLRARWAVFKHLFISNPDRTKEFGERLGGLLGFFQSHLQDGMIIGIARLLDRDGLLQKNLTMWSLAERCERWEAPVAIDVRSALGRLVEHVSELRSHRHKRIAHFDLPASLGHSRLPDLTFAKIREAIEQLETILNLVSQRAVNTTTMFAMLDHRDITTTAEITIYKAMAYDVAVAEGKIELLDWRKHIFQ